MRKNSNFTIVYVFGPEQWTEKYDNNDPMDWLKIGQTDFVGNIDEVTPEMLKEQSMSRIKDERKTGIPRTCIILDVFIFPKIIDNGIQKNVNIDDRIREKLCSKLYVIENSKQINKELRTDRSRIQAGDEFVYGACRSQILYAVQSYDHELFQNADYDVNMLATICRCNNKDINSGAQDDDNERLASRSRKPTLDLNRILNEGDEVVLTNGSGETIVDENGLAITAKYVGENKFNCRDEVKRSSPLALYYLNKYGGRNLSTVNGNDYWRFNGQKLSSLRENYQEEEEDDQFV